MQTENITETETQGCSNKQENIKKKQEGWCSEKKINKNKTK